MTPAGAKLLLLIAASGTAGTWMALPQAVPPREPPSLVVDRGATARVIDADRRLAAEAPRSEAVLALRRLVTEQGAAEVGPGEPAGSVDRRRAALRRAADRILRDHGVRALLATRAAAVERLGPALSGREDDEARAGLLGSFPRMLDRYALRVRGARIAPFFVVRTLFKARWNALVGRSLTWELVPVERLAYFGWLALHAHGADPALRLDALERFAAEGGARVDEARAVLALAAGRRVEAARAMEDALAAHGGLRLRNHALALLE
ncbi:MAG: hypothetical protein ACODAU_09605 [Myxococcota bacterium]